MGNRRLSGYSLHKHERFDVFWWFLACRTPQLAILAEELPAAILSVQGTASDDVWLVGADAGDGPYVRHWDGAAWEALPTATRGDLWWAWPSEGRVTVVGEGLILDLDRADGARTPAADVDPALTFFGVWGASEADGWAVGGAVDGGLAPQIWRRDAAGWSRYHDAVVDALPTTSLLYKVHGTAADDVWVVGNDATVLHFDGQAFSVSPAGPSAPLFTVTATPTPIAVGGAGQAVIRHWEDDAWVDHTPDFSPQLNGVASDRDATVAVGVQGTVARWDGRAWTLDDARPTGFDFHATWLDGAGGWWAVGGALSVQPLAHGFLAYTGPDDVPPPP